MASGLLGIMTNVISSPATMLFLQLTSGSLVLGFSAPRSWYRRLALPVASACVYGIAQNASAFVRPRWASLLAGTSFSFLLQYLDMALISRWSFETHGPPTKQPQITNVSHMYETNDSIDAKGDCKYSARERFSWAWNTLWSFRHVDTPYEASNTPPFSRKDPSYVPSRPLFVAQRTATAAVCYLILDLLAVRPAPSNSAALFDPALIPFFRRLGHVTLAQIELRALSIGGFGLTFYCVIQGFHSALAALTVGLGRSHPRSWRPPFGSISEAYSLRNFWGKVWHQNLRRQITSPALYISRYILGLPAQSIQGRYTTVLLSFAASGIMHTVAGLASGASLKGSGVFQFFCTQALGVLLESSIQTLWNRETETDMKRTDKPSWPARCLGYAWVAAFLAWSGPVWLYPQAARVRPMQPDKPTGFLPFSVVKLFNART